MTASNIYYLQTNNCTDFWGPAKIGQTVVLHCGEGVRNNLY